MNRSDRIIAILTKELHPTRLELQDDSHKHAGHSGAREGGETHYSLVIESEAFCCMSAVQMHQQIYALLDAEFKNGLHALAIKASAPKN